MSSRRPRLEATPTRTERLAAAAHVALLGPALDPPPAALRARLDLLAKRFIAALPAPPPAGRRRERHG
jgi:hypothetical protein